jgi:hypothetical protein
MNMSFEQVKRHQMVFRLAMRRAAVIRLIQSSDEARRRVDGLIAAWKKAGLIDQDYGEA